MTKKLIGIVGGLGPYAGLDLVKKIFDQTMANKDSEHLDIVLLSEPSDIPDRTEFLLNKSTENPAWKILERLRKLKTVGVTLVGIPCNTSHATEIMDVIKDGIAKEGLGITLIDMMTEIVAYEQAVNRNRVRRPGLLATLGSYKAGVHQKAFEKAGAKIVIPSEKAMEQVNKAIYDKSFGLKAQANPISAHAKDILLKAVDDLLSQGANSLVLGCTELSLALQEKIIRGLPVVDSTVALARALVREAAPEKLRPLQ